MPRWTELEDTRIRRKYPLGDRREICAMLPGRSWIAIQCRASKLGVVRRWRLEGVVKTRAYHGTALQRDLIYRRLKAGLTQAKLAALLPNVKQARVSQLENGRHCTMANLIAWCDALGLELRAMPKTKPLNTHGD